MPKVSFLLPVYNGARYLAETLDSLLAQDHDDYDIVVIDDGSTDASAEIVARANSPLIRYHHQPNGGLVAALNNGLALLDCDFVARIDADDLCAPNRLTQQLDFIAFTGAVAVSSRSLHIDEDGNVLGPSGLFSLFDADPRRVPAAEPYLPHPFLFARLDTLADLGFRNAHLAEDADLCWRLAEHWPIAVQNAVLGRYRLHKSSVSIKSTASARVQAFFSQVAALNAVHRLEETPELPYAVPMADAMAAGAEGWDALMAIYRESLTEDEATWLRTASLLKLLDSAEWRGYQVTPQDMTDAAYALQAMRGGPGAADAADQAEALLSRATEAERTAKATHEPARGFAERVRGFLRRA